MIPHADDHFANAYVYRWVSPLEARRIRAESDLRLQTNFLWHCEREQKKARSRANIVANAVIAGLLSLLLVLVLLTWGK